MVSTRQTELCESFPSHVVCAWLGNSRAVAQDNYLQVTDAHFERALQAPHQRAAQNPAQLGAVNVRIGKEVPAPENENRPELPGDTSPYHYLNSGQVTPAGFEPASPP